MIILFVFHIVYQYRIYYRDFIGIYQYVVHFFHEKVRYFDIKYKHA